MNKTIFITLLLVSVLVNFKSHGMSLKFNAATIDTQAQQLMKRESVQGLALAFIENGKVKHVAAYGYRNVDYKLPLTLDTIMYGASLTKTAFAYMIMQLVDEGRLDLDASVADLLPKPLPEYDKGDDDYSDLGNDIRWKSLTPRIILNNATGFANFRWLEKDGLLRFHHDPGSRYGYSAEGYYILQLIIEQGLGLDVNNEMQTRVFDLFGMSNTGMKWRSDFANNLADGYALDGTMQPHDERSGVSAAGSMDTSIHDQALLWAGIVSGEGLTKSSRAELVRPQLAITSAHQFPSLMAKNDEKNKEINLAAGLGLVTFEDTSGPAWFKGGHNSWTGNMVICLETGMRCVVMMANDVRAELIYPELTKLILGETNMPWRWEYN